MNSQKRKHDAELGAPASSPAARGVPAPFRLLVCDDQMLVRTGVRQMLKNHPSIHVIGEAANGSAAVRMALEMKPDIILMDVSMPDLDGIEATFQILSKAPGVKILAFSVDCSPETISKMLSAGARGYLFKLNIAAELILALQKVLAGEFFLSAKPPTRGPVPDQTHYDHE